MLIRVLVMLLGTAALLPAQTANPVVSSFTAAYNNVRQNLEEAADLMPEDNYSFKPTPAIREYGEWIEHTALANYNFCSAIKGEQNPRAGQQTKLKTKAEISKALKESFEYCTAAFKDLNDEKVTADVTTGTNKYKPVQRLFAYIGTLNSHYGNLVIYLRLKNLVPPSTARAQKAQKR